MIQFFCDLDNTLIYSHRRTINAPKRVAEIYHGVEQSYITEKTFEYLSSIKQVEVIPVTTRTLPQFKRLQATLNDLHCVNSIILNGAILLMNGEEDEDWAQESRVLIGDSTDELHKMADLLELYCNQSLRYSDEFLVYANTHNPSRVAKLISEEINTDLISVFYDTRKVYGAPIIINKGSAVKRFKERHPDNLTIAVGDSQNDISMLEHVDIPILPKSLDYYVKNHNKIVISSSDVLSDSACDVLNRLIN